MSSNMYALPTCTYWASFLDIIIIIIIALRDQPDVDLPAFLVTLWQMQRVYWIKHLWHCTGHYSLDGAHGLMEKK